MKFRLLGACALLTWATSAAAERPTFYQACDGYGSPTQTGDGMTKEATGLFGLIGTLGSSGNTRRSTPPLGAAGIAACDQALADARLIEKHVLRRSNLLRARAVHDLAVSRPDDALKDLDRAAALVRGSNDPYVNRSLMLGIDLVRGYALLLKGDRAQAAPLVERVQVQRPFDRHLGLAAMAMLGDDRAVVHGAPLAQQVARLDPRLVDLLFQSAFDRDEFATVIALHPHLRAPTRTGDIGVSRVEQNVQEAKKDIEEIRFGADRGGRLADALAALGKPAESKAAIAAARAGVDAATPRVMPPPVDGKEGSKARLQRTINTALIKTALAAGQRLDDWAALASLRTELADLAPDVATQRILNAKVPAAGAGLDLLKTLRPEVPSDQKLQATIEALEKRINAPVAITAKDAELLFNALPHTEIADRVNSYRKANSDLVGYFWGGISGFKTKDDARDPNRVTIKFTGEKSSGGVVEEMTLLRAADYARGKGKSGFVILDRSDYQRTVNTTYYGATLRSDPDGYSTELEVEMVDMAHLPDRYRGAAWRAIPVDQVLAQLGPIYMGAPAPAAGGKSTAR